jgi:hypothetical protein
MSGLNGPRSSLSSRWWFAGMFWYRIRRDAGDCRLKSRRKGRVRLIGVGADPGVLGGSPAVDGLVTFDPWE